MHTVSRSTVSRRLAVAIAVILTLGFAGVPVVRADVTSAPVLAETAVDRQGSSMLSSTPSRAGSSILTC